MNRVIKPFRIPDYEVVAMYGPALQRQRLTEKLIQQASGLLQPQPHAAERASRDRRTEPVN